MKIGLVIFSRLTIAVVLSSLMGLAIADTQQALFDKELKFTREVLSKQRKDLIQKYMGLSAFDEKEFWGVYNRYRDEMKPVLDQTVTLLTEYSTALEKKNLTDEMALEFTKTSIMLQGAKLALRRDYISEFKKFLKPKQVARFIQLETKIDAIISYDLARKVPLVPTESNSK